MAKQSDEQLAYAIGTADAGFSLALTLVFAMIVRNRMTPHEARELLDGMLVQTEAEPLPQDSVMAGAQKFRRAQYEKAIDALEFTYPTLKRVPL